MASLRVKDRGHGPMFYGRWRVDGSRRVIERPIGRGWLVGVGERGAKPNGKTIGAFRERSGRAPEGFLTIQAATQTLAEVERAWAAEQLQVAREEQRANGEGLTVRDATDRYLEWGSATTRTPIATAGSTRMRRTRAPTSIAWCASSARTACSPRSPRRT